MQRMKPVDCHVVGKLATAANARNDQDLVRGNLLLGQGHLDGIQDAVIAATRAPDMRKFFVVTQILVHEFGNLCHGSLFLYASFISRS